MKERDSENLERIRELLERHSEPDTPSYNPDDEASGLQWTVGILVVVVLVIILCSLPADWAARLVMR